METCPPHYIPSLETFRLILQSAVHSCLIILNTELKAPDLQVSWFIIHVSVLQQTFGCLRQRLQNKRSRGCTDCEENLWDHCEEETWKHTVWDNVSTVQDTLSDHEACWECKVGFTFLQISWPAATERITTKRWRRKRGRTWWRERSNKRQINKAEKGENKVEVMCGDSQRDICDSASLCLHHRLSALTLLPWRDSMNVHKINCFDICSWNRNWLLIYVLISCGE